MPPQKSLQNKRKPLSPTSDGSNEAPSDSVADPDWDAAIQTFKRIKTGLDRHFPIASQQTLSLRRAYNAHKDDATTKAKLIEQLESKVAAFERDNKSLRDSLDRQSSESFDLQEKLLDFQAKLNSDEIGKAQAEVERALAEKDKAFMAGFEATERHREISIVLHETVTNLKRK